MGYTEIIKEVGNVADKVSTTDEERDLIKKDLVLSEMNSDDNYTKRARPSIVYVGLGVVVLELLGVRLLVLSLAFSEKAMFEMALAASNAILLSFMAAWAGVSGLYNFSRSQEKREAYTERKKARFENKVQLARIKSEKKGLFDRNK